MQLFLYILLNLLKHGRSSKGKNDSACFKMLNTPEKCTKCVK